MTTLNAPAELMPLLEPLRPLLEQCGATELRTFSYRRPGESDYWLSYVYIGDVRHSEGTPDLRHLPLAAQAQSLVSQLQAWLANRELSLREAAVAADLYRFDDQAYVRAAKRGRPKT